jgi:hypothetical protein
VTSKLKQKKFSYLDFGLVITGILGATIIGRACLFSRSPIPRKFGGLKSFGGFPRPQNPYASIVPEKPTNFNFVNQYLHKDKKIQSIYLGAIKKRLKEPMFQMASFEEFKKATIEEFEKEYRQVPKEEDSATPASTTASTTPSTGIKFESKMSLEEASKIIAIPLTDAWNPKLITQAHRRVILRNHPDRGGSPFLATKINEAKEKLMAMDEATKNKFKDMATGGDEDKEVKESKDAKDGKEKEGKDKENEKKEGKDKEGEEKVDEKEGEAKEKDEMEGLEIDKDDEEEHEQEITSKKKPKKKKRPAFDSGKGY